jgi:hypothetical protein
MLKLRATEKILKKNIKKSLTAFQEFAIIILVRTTNQIFKNEREEKHYGKHNYNYNYNKDDKERDIRGNAETGSGSGK